MQENIQTTDIVSRLKRVFPQFLATDLLFKLVAFLILTPLVSWIFSLVISSSGRSAVSNTDIVKFFLSPIGLVGSIVVGALALGIIFAEEAILLTVAYAQEYGRKLSWRNVVAISRKHIKSLVSLGLVWILTILVLVLPVAAVVGWLYVNNLTKYDINYYLKSTPPEFWQTVAIAAPLLIGLVALLSYLFVAWSLALPGVIFEEIPARQALKRSRKRVEGSSWRVAKILLGWTVGWALFSILIQIVLGWIADLIFAAVGDQLGFLATLMGFFILLSGLFLFLGTFIWFSVYTLLTMGVYHALARDDKEDSPVQAYIEQMPEHEEGGLPVWVSRGAIGVAVLLAVGAVIFASSRLIESISNDEKVIISAHRGSSEVAPPNTLAAVQAAIDDGADYAEIDVQETADGIVILNHDSDFKLVAGLPLKVHEATYEQVKEIDVGSSFSPEFAGEKVATLDEVLQLSKDKIKVMIEIKTYGHDQKVAERVVEDVRKHGMEEQVVIMSLDHDKTQEAKQIAPNIPVGFLASDFTVGDLTALNVDFLAVSSGMATMNLIDAAHGSNKPLYVWTINEPVEISKYISRGVDGIITDRPDTMHEVIAEHAQMSDSERLLLSFSHRFAD